MNMDKSLVLRNFTLLSHRTQDIISKSILITKKIYPQDSTQDFPPSIFCNESIEAARKDKLGKKFNQLSK